MMKNVIMLIKNFYTTQCNKKHLRIKQISFKRELFQQILRT